MNKYLVGSELVGRSFVVDADRPAANAGKGTVLTNPAPPPPFTLPDYTPNTPPASPQSPPPASPPGYTITNTPSTAATATPFVETPSWTDAFKNNVKVNIEKIKETVAETPPWQIALGVVGAGLLGTGIYALLSKPTGETRLA